MKKYITHISVVLMSLLGLYLRIRMINIPTTQLYDFSTYYEVANNVFTGMGFSLKGYPMAWQGMGYSTILGLWFKIFGESSEELAKAMNIVMSMLTIYTVYYLLHQITKNKKIILLTMVGVIFMPQHIAYCNTIGTEVMSAFALSLVIAIQVTPFNWKFKYPILGAAIGVLSLIKPFFMMYPIMIGLIHWLTEKDIKETLKLTGISFACMAIVIAPWTYRNYQKFDRFIPISYNSGFNLYINNNPNNVHGGWQSFDDIYKTPELQEKIDQHLSNPLGSVKIASDIELDFKPEAQKWIKEHPIEFLKLGFIRTHATYFNGAWDIEDWAMNDYREELKKTEDKYMVDRHFRFMESLYDLLQYVVTVLGLLFIILNFKQMILAIVKLKERVSLFKAITFMNLSYVSLVYFVYEGQPRYNFIILFLLIMAASEMIINYLEHKEA